MKIIEPPPVDGWPREVECASCKARLEVDLSDLEYDSWKVSGYHFNGTAVCKWLYTYQFDEAEIPVQHRGVRVDQYTGKLKGIE